VIDASLPKGPVWVPKPDGDFDKYLDAWGDDLEIGRASISKIEKTRDPSKTECLADLEIDFGVLPNDTIDEDTRRQYLSAVKGASQLETGSAPELQERLRAAGFNVYVYKNDPPIDPAEIMMSVYNSTCGDVESTCGNPDATCGLGPPGDSEFIVNGDIIVNQYRDWSATCGDGETTCVDASDDDYDGYFSTCGQFSGMAREKYYYPCPVNPARWKYIFWIAASRSGYGVFNDWNMEHSGVANWEENNGARATKTQEYKSSGIRALMVQQWGVSLSGDGPYVENTLDTIVSDSVTVTVNAWAYGTYAPVLMVCDKDGVWDTVGKITGSTTAPTNYEWQTLSYSATNGVSAVRLYVWGALFGPVGQAVFDDVEIIGPTFTRAQVLEELRLNLRRLILKLKPLDTWAGLLVDYYTDEPIVPGEFDEDEMDTYRTQTFTEAQTVWLYETETAMRINFVGSVGTETEALVRFDDAQNFTQGRSYRLVNADDAAEITVGNYDLSVTKVLPPGGIMEVYLRDNSTAAGDWVFLTHITGDAEEDV